MKYEALFGRESPTRTRKHIIARLAYRIQELAYGGLSAEARARLEAIYEGKGLPGQTTGPAKKERKGAPAPGTKLIRDYLGTTHEVIVREKGFDYKGGIYRSLSSIATEISGSHVSGPAFFGLQKKGCKA